MADKKQPIRLTQQRAEALVAVFEEGALKIEGALRDAMRFAALRTADEMQDLKAADLQLAAAYDAIAIVKHRYLHGEELTTPHATLF